MNKETYITAPCRASSLPFWKTNCVKVPDFIRVVRDDQLTPEMLQSCRDEPYFKLCHDFRRIRQVTIPAGFKLITPTAAALSRHIEACYPEERASEEELLLCQNRAVYRPELWIALVDSATEKIAASGIAELDAEIGEGVLEWIQVSPAYRRRGLGEAIVRELLGRLKTMADFVTVSGRMNNETRPELLYKKCGFGDMVIWHVLMRT